MVRFERAGWQPTSGALAAVGVAVPLAVGAAAGHLDAGATAAAGALPAGVAAMTAGVRVPTALMATTSCGMALSTFVGSAASGTLWASLVAVAAWGFAAGLLVSAGRAATIVGIQAAVALVVFGRFPGGPLTAAGHAGWVLAGGGLQVALALLLRVPRHAGPGRAALARAFDALAVVAADPASAGAGLTAAEAVGEASQVVAGAEAAGDRPGLLELRSLADETGRLRRELLALGHLRLAAPPGEVAGPLDTVTAEAGRRLRVAAEALRRRRAPAAASPDGPAEAAVRRLRELADRPGPAAALAGVATARCAALLGQLRAVQRLTASLAGVRLRAPSPVGRARGVPAAVVAVGRQVRLGTAPGSPALRHAVRLGVALPAAELVARALPWQRGYWVALTALVVLKPDFAATVTRGLARIAGTLAGVVLAGLIVTEVRPGPAALVAVIAVLAWASYSLFAANYATYAVFLTALVVLLVSAGAGGPALSTAGDRALDTLVGGGLAVLAYVLWPTWEGPALREAAAALLDRLAGYADAVCLALVDPGRRDDPAIAAAAVAARKARSTAQASLDRALGEPAARRGDTATATGVLAGARRVVIGLHALRADLQDRPDASPAPGLEPAAGALVTGLHALAAAVRAGRPPEVPPLRDLQQRLADADDGRLRELALLLDPLVDGVDTVADVLGERGEVPLAVS